MEENKNENIGKRNENPELEQGKKVMFCNQCGTKLTKEGEFCPNCGARIKKSNTNRPVSRENHERRIENTNSYTRDNHQNQSVNSRDNYQSQNTSSRDNYQSQNMSSRDNYQSQNTNSRNNYQSQNTYPQQNYPYRSGENQNKKFIIIILALLVLLSLAVFGYAKLKYSKTDNTLKTENENPAPQSESAKNSEPEEKNNQEEAKKDEVKEQDTDNSEQMAKNREKLYDEIGKILDNNFKDIPIREFEFYFCDVKDDEPFITVDAKKPIDALGLAHLYLMAELGFTRFPNLTDREISDIQKTMTTIDNEATNRLIDAAGIKNIDERIKKMGFTSATRFQRRMLDEKAEREGRENTTCAFDTGNYLKYLYNDQYNSSSSPLTKGMPDAKKFTNTMLYYMGNTVEDHRRAAADIIDYSNDSGIKVFNKIGMHYGKGIYNDCDIVKTKEGAYVICYFIKGEQGRPENEMRAIKNSSNEIYNEYKKYKEGYKNS